MQQPPSPSLFDLTRVFGRIGILSFGGPAAQIALMHRELVEARRWLTEETYLRALSFCMMLPGPEAMQLATYSGWRLHGVRGGLIAGLLFVMPGALLILALAALHSTLGTRPEAQGLLLGIKACVVVIVFQALLRLGGRALKGRDAPVIAVLAFAALFLFNLPFPVVILAAGLWGAHRATGSGHAAEPPSPEAALRPTLTRIAVWSAIWLIPLAALWLLEGGLLARIGSFFSGLAMLTFGGAYAVLAWMAQAVVDQHGWLTPGEMLDALGLAETTPGPLILVTAFVGFLAGAKAGGPLMGVAAWAVTLWMTFAPCFLWIFAGAPFIDQLTRRPRLAAALAAITAAVVGVIGNLSVWFAFHVFFARTLPVTTGPLHMTLPDLSTAQPAALALAVVAGGLLLGRGWGLVPVLALTALLGAGITLI